LFFGYLEAKYSHRLLVGKIMGQDIRMLENQGKVEIYKGNHLMQSLDFNR